MKVHNGWEAFGVVGALVALGVVMSHGVVSQGLAAEAGTVALGGLKTLELQNVQLNTSSLSGK